VTAPAGIRKTLREILAAGELAIAASAIKQLNATGYPA